MFGQTGLLLVVFGSLAAAGQGAGQAAVRTAWHSQRRAASDLEVTGLVAKLPQGASGYLSRAFLLGLPQVTTELKRDENFPELSLEGVRASGVELSEIVKAVGSGPGSVAVSAVCRDRYTAPFTHTYLERHHPILVLTLDGLSPHDWAAKNHTYDPSPYFVVYERFEPAFQVLSHKEWQQEPAEIVRLAFVPSEELYRAIMPSASQAAQPGVEDGFRIAQENCFRCHNAGTAGGMKAGRSWQRLGKRAKSDPAYFARWVQRPQSIDAAAQMPPNPQYDQATLNALTRYFQTFAEGR